jgi:hypothetical protein
VRILIAVIYSHSHLDFASQSEHDCAS